MMDFSEIKQKILTDDNVASAFEYMLSKMVFENPVKPLQFIYKKCKIATGRNNLYSIYDAKTGIKLYNKIYFQEVAKYVVDNLNCYGKISHILFLENELIRYKEKIDFFKKYYMQKKTDILGIKLSAMYDSYFQIKNSLLNVLKENIGY